MLQNLGYNLNASVSMFLHGFHNIVPITYYQYLGEEEVPNHIGVYQPHYAPPVVLNCQQQSPGTRAMQYVRKNVDIKDVKQFWVNAEIEPVQRVGDKGGDLIRYLDGWYYVEAMPDDFLQVGWVSVIGVLTFEPIIP